MTDLAVRASLILAGGGLFLIAILSAFGFWKILALLGLGEGWSVSRSLRRQSREAAEIAQALRELRDLKAIRDVRRNPWGRPPPHDGAATPFDDDAELARAWREASRRAQRASRPRP